MLQRRHLLCNTLERAPTWSVDICCTSGSQTDGLHIVGFVVETWMEWGSTRVPLCPVNTGNGLGPGTRSVEIRAPFEFDCVVDVKCQCRKVMIVVST